MRFSPDPANIIPAQVSVLAEKESYEIERMRNPIASLNLRLSGIVLLANLTLNVLAPCVFGAALPQASSNATANFLINGGFDTELAPWGWDDRYIQPPGSGQWTSLDAGGSALSGSARLTVTVTGRARQLLQCVTLAPGQIHEFGAKAYFPPEQTTEGYAVLGYVEYPSQNCSGAFSGFGVLQSLHPTSKGTFVPMSARPPLGPSAGSMQVIIGSVLVSGDSYTVHFDDAFVRVQPASVVVSALPDAMVQEPGRAGGEATYSLTNVGEFPTTITLSQQGSFFAQSPSAFMLQPRQSQTVRVTALAQPLGTHDGSSVPSGEGVPLGLSIPIRLAVVPTSGTSSAVPTENRIDLSAAEGVQSYEASVRFSNPGSETLRGIASSDAPWIVVSDEEVSIPPGTSVPVPFSVNRAARNDGERVAGSTTGTVTLRYLAGEDGGATRSTAAGPTSVTSSSTAKDSAARPPLAAAPPPLGGSVALFIPGVGHVQGSVGTFISDVSIVAAKTVGLSSRLDVFFVPASSATEPLVNSFQLQPSQLLSLADVVGSYFGRKGELGSLQLRTLRPDLLYVTAGVINKSNPAGTYGTAIPVLRSDRSVEKAGRTFLTGLAGRSETRHTNLILQETAGAPTRLEIVFLNAAGGQIGGSSVVDLDAFASKRLDDVVPEGVVSAILTNRFDSAGKFSVIATPVDKARETDGSMKGGDTWVVADWPMIGGYLRNRPVIIPVAGIVRGANDSHFRTDVAIMSTNEYQATGELTFHPQGGTPVTRQLTLQRYESKVFENVLTSLFGVVDNQVGYLTFRPLAPAYANWLLTGRVFATVGNQVATFGTGVPAVDVGSAMGRGELRRFAGFDDSGDESIVAGRPATFRSNLGLVETTGHPVKVRVTLYNAVPGDPATQATVQPRIFELGPREFRLISRISREILGARRGEFRDDLRDLYLDVEVIEGEGKIIAFVSSVDNGTADQVLQIP